MNVYIKFLSVLVLFTSYSITKSIAQEQVQLEPYTPGVEYTMKDGLPSNHIYMVIQDEKGYFWIATDNGISKFDGYEFKNYSVQDGLPTNDIYELQEDKWGRIWLLNDTNKPTYLRGDSIKQIDVQLQLGSSFYVFEDNQRMNFLSYSEKNKNTSIVVFPNDSFEFKFNLETYENNHIIKKINRHIEEDKNDPFLFWNSCSGDTLFSTLPRKRFISGKYNDELCFIQLNRFKPGFISSEKHLNYFYLNYHYKALNQPYTVTRMPRFNSYQIKVGNNMVRIDSNNCDYLIYNHEFNNKYYVNRIYVDLINENWLSTEKGIFVVGDWKRRNNLRCLDVDISLLASTENCRDVYFVDIKEGVVLYKMNKDKKANIFELSTEGKVEINDLVLDENNLFVLQKGQGVSKLENLIFKSNLFSNYIIDSENINNFGLNSKQIIPNFNSSNFVFDGISLYLINEKEEKLSIVSDKHTFSMFKGEESKAAFINTERGIEIYKYRDSIYLDHIIKLESIEKIIPFKSDSFLAFSVKGESFICDEFNCEKLNGLDGKVITTGFASQDTVWLIHNDQIIKSYIDVNNIENSIYEELLPNGILGEHVVLTDIVVSDSSIYLASNEGLFSMNRNLTKPEEITIPFEFKSIKSPDSTYQISENTLIPYGQNSITLEYTTIYYTSVGIEYHYQLLPIDDELQNSSSRSVRYADLNAGEYTFLIYATDQNGNRTEQNQIKFTIATPWWQSLLFKVLVGLLILLMVYLIYRRQINKIQKEQAKQIVINKRFAELELNALQSQMNPHFVFNTLNALQNLVEDNDEADVYISKFSSLMRLFLESSKQKYITIEEELQIVKLYVDLEKMRFKDKFEFEIQDELSEDEKQEQIPSTILQPFVENALNHGIFHKEGKGKLKVELTKDKDSLIIRIEDDGIGRKAANEINKRNRFGHKSFAIENVKNKFETVKTIDDYHIDYQIIDKNSKEGNPLGTIVEITIGLDES